MVIKCAYWGILYQSISIYILVWINQGFMTTMVCSHMQCVCHTLVTMCSPEHKDPNL